MDLNHITAFVRVVEAGSFTAAARALELPKSSVSRSVAQLERELGILLMQRTTRKLSLTDAGRQYFDRARVALGELDDASASVANLGSEPRGVVRLTAPVDIAVMMLTGIVRDYLAAHPKVTVDLTLGGRRVDLVEEGIDIAVRAGALGDSSLVARKVATTELGLYASPEYLERRGRPRTLGDLAAHDCVLFRAGRGGARWQLTGPDGDESVHVDGRVRADEMSFVQAAVAAGLGIGMLPSFRCTEQPSHHAIERVLPTHAVKGTPVSVVTTSVRTESLAVASFRKFLIERLLVASWTDAAERCAEAAAGTTRARPGRRRSHPLAGP